MTYVAGFLTPVPNENKEAYIDSARKAWPLFKDYGALLNCPPFRPDSLA